MKKLGLLDVVAEQHRTFISNLRLLPELKWAALGDLYRLPEKERYPLKEWEEAVSYLLGCEVHFENYEDNREKPQALFPASEVTCQNASIVCRTGQTSPAC